MADPRPKSFYFALGLMLGGALIVTSVIWRRADSGRSAWSDEQANAYSTASKSYHALSYQRPTPEVRQALEAAKVDYERLRDQLDSARDRGDRWARWLGWVGVVLAMVSLVGYASCRSVSADS